MALTSLQQAALLFKKWLGKGQTTPGREFFNEPYAGAAAVLPTQIWTNADQIPVTASGFSSSGQTIGVVQYHIGVGLSAVAGTSSSFYNSLLVDAIPFYYGPSGSYNYYQWLTGSNGANIAGGVGDWVVDGEAGLLTFYSSVPANVPPTMSFFRYVGNKGLRVWRAGTGHWIRFQGLG